MKYTLAAYEKKSFNSSGGIFTVLALALGGSVELSAKGIEEIPLDNTDQINIGDVQQITLQNITADPVEIEFTILSKAVSKKAQAVKSEITNAVNIASMPAVQVEAIVSAAATGNDPVNVVIPAGESREILPINTKRHTASIVRGEADLYNIKLAYGSSVNAQNGIPFAPQATAKIQSKASVWAHNHSAFSQAVIAIDTSIL